MTSPETPPLPSEAPLISATDNAQPAPTRQRSWLWIMLTLILIGSGLGLGYLFRPQQTPAQSGRSQGPPPRPVETVSLTPGNGVRTVQLIGQVEATEQATIRARTEGVVQQVLVEPGDRVTAGMAIAILDDAEQRLGVAEAQARLAQERSRLARLEVGTRPEIIAQRRAELKSAEAREQETLDNLNRNRELVQQGAIAQRTMVEAEAALNAAQGDRLQAAAALAEAEAGPTREEIEAQQGVVAAALAALNQAKLNLERTRIQAVTSGVVQSKAVSPGDFVESGDPLLTLVDREELDLFLELPENLTGNVSVGLPVKLSARALPDWQTNATITGVVPAANAASRRQMVRVRLTNPPAGLVPGMAVQGELALRSNIPGFVISRDALTRQRDQWLVFTVVEGKAKPIQVELVADMGAQVAIAHPQLRAGMPIVIRGGDGLKPGASVKLGGPQR